MLDSRLQTPTILASWRCSEATCAVGAAPKVTIISRCHNLSVCGLLLSRGAHTFSVMLCRTSLPTRPISGIRHQSQALCWRMFPTHPCPLNVSAALELTIFRLDRGGSSMLSSSLPTGCDHSSGEAMSSWWWMLEDCQPGSAHACSRTGRRTWPTRGLPRAVASIDSRRDAPCRSACWPRLCATKSKTLCPMASQRPMTPAREASKEQVRHPPCPPSVVPPARIHDRCLPGQTSSLAGFGQAPRRFVPPRSASVPAKPSSDRPRPGTKAVPAGSGPGSVEEILASAFDL